MRNMREYAGWEKAVDVARGLRKDCAACARTAGAFLRHMRLPLMLAFLHFFVTTVFQLDKAFFVYDETFIMHTKTHGDISVFWYYCAVKVLYALFLAVLYCAVASLCRAWKAGSACVRRGLQVFFCYLLLMLALLLVLWPGTWAWDDILTVVSLHKYSGSWWQHFITSIVQIVFLQLIPCPGGIIIVQNVIISACVAYTVTELESCFLGGRVIKNAGIDTLVKVLPFLLPGVLSYQFSGYRLGLYVYLELALFVMLISARMRGNVWTVPKTFLYAVLAVLVAEWRTEGLFFFPLSCALLLAQKNCRVRTKVFGITCIVLGFAGTDFVQKKLLGNSNYEVISTMTPAVELIRNADARDRAEIAALGRVLNVQAVYDYPDKDGTALYWLEEAHAVRSDYTKADYRAYLRAFFTLSLRHPRVVARERLSMFMRTSGFWGKTNVINLNYSGNKNEVLDISRHENEGVREFAAYPHNQPIFKPLRTRLLRLWIHDCTYRVVWNPVIPMLFLFTAWVFCLARRKWYVFLLLTGEAVRVVLSFLTAPSPWFMYYLLEYLLGWTLAVYALLFVLRSHAAKQSASRT